MIVRSGLGVVIGAALLACAMSTAACDGTPRPGAQRTADAAAVPAPTPVERDLVGKIVNAEKTCVFAGWKTLYHGPRSGSRASRVHVYRDGEGTTLLTWEGDGDSNGNWSYRSRQRWLEHPDLLLANYSVSLDDEPGEPVAWRPTRTVHVRGRRAGRPSLDVVVDAETWLPVGDVRRDHLGDVASAWEFDSLDYDPPPATDPAAKPETLCAPADDQAARCAFEPLLVGEVPAGFERVASRVLDCGSLREFWSDGLAAFAVRQRPFEPGAPGEGVESLAPGEIERRSSKGRANVRGHLGGMLVEVAGTLPIDELEQVARGLRARATE